MGYWKDRQIQEWDQGWSFVDDDRMVCAECFEDYAVKDFIEDNATETSCSYCGRSAEEEIGAPMNEVLRLIVASSRPPAVAGAAYRSGIGVEVT